MSETSPVLSYETSFRVRYAETDQMGVVYYANYLIWMELGRAEYCRAAGIRYRDMEVDDGILLAVIEAHCRYLHPARYDERLRVRTRIAEAKNRTIRFSYQIFRADDDRLLATGETVHVICGSNGKPKLLPEKYRTAFSAALAAPAGISKS